MQSGLYKARDQFYLDYGDGDAGGKYGYEDAEQGKDGMSLPMVANFYRGKSCAYLRPNTIGRIHNDGEIECISCQNNVYYICTSNLSVLRYWYTYEDMGIPKCITTQLKLKSLKSSKRKFGGVVCDMKGLYAMVWTVTGECFFFYPNEKSTAENIVGYSFAQVGDSRTVGTPVVKGATFIGPGINDTVQWILLTQNNQLIGVTHPADPAKLNGTSISSAVSLTRLVVPGGESKGSTSSMDNISSVVSQPLVAGPNFDRKSRQPPVIVMCHLISGTANEQISIFSTVLETGHVGDISATLSDTTSSSYKKTNVWSRVISSTNDAMLKSRVRKDPNSTFIQNPIMAIGGELNWFDAILGFDSKSFIGSRVFYASEYSPDVAIPIGDIQYTEVEELDKIPGCDDGDFSENNSGPKQKPMNQTSHQTLGSVGGDYTGLEKVMSVNSGMYGNKFDSAAESSDCYAKSNSDKYHYSDVVKTPGATLSKKGLKASAPNLKPYLFFQTVYNVVVILNGKRTKGDLDGTKSNKLVVLSQYTHELKDDISFVLGEGLGSIVCGCFDRETKTLVLCDERAVYNLHIPDESSKYEDVVNCIENYGYNKTCIELCQIGEYEDAIMYAETDVERNYINTQWALKLYNSGKFKSIQKSAEKFTSSTLSFAQCELALLNKNIFFLAEFFTSLAKKLKANNKQGGKKDTGDMESHKNDEQQDSALFSQLALETYLITRTEAKRVDLITKYWKDVKNKAKKKSSDAAPDDPTTNLLTNYVISNPSSNNKNDKEGGSQSTVNNSAAGNKNTANNSDQNKRKKNNKGKGDEDFFVVTPKEIQDKLCSLIEHFANELNPSITSGSLTRFNSGETFLIFMKKMNDYASIVRYYIFNKDIGNAMLFMQKVTDEPAFYRLVQFTLAENPEKTIEMLKVMHHQSLSYQGDTSVRSFDVDPGKILVIMLGTPRITNTLIREYLRYCIFTLQSKDEVIHNHYLHTLAEDNDIHDIMVFLNQPQRQQHFSPEHAIDILRRKGLEHLLWRAYAALNMPMHALEALLGHQGNDNKQGEDHENVANVAPTTTVTTEREGQEMEDSLRFLLNEENKAYVREIPQKYKVTLAKSLMIAQGLNDGISSLDSQINNEEDVNRTVRCVYLRILHWLSNEVHAPTKSLFGFAEEEAKGILSVDDVLKLLPPETNAHLVKDSLQMTLAGLDAEHRAKIEEINSCVITARNQESDMQKVVRRKTVLKGVPRCVVCGKIMLIDNEPAVVFPCGHNFCENCVQHKYKELDELDPNRNKFDILEKKIEECRKKNKSIYAAAKQVRRGRSMHEALGLNDTEPRRVQVKNINKIYKDIELVEISDCPACGLLAISLLDSTLKSFNL